MAKSKITSFASFSVDVVKNSLQDSLVVQSKRTTTPGADVQTISMRRTNYKTHQWFSEKNKLQDLPVVQSKSTTAPGVVQNSFHEKNKLEDSPVVQSKSTTTPGADVQTISMRRTIYKTHQWSSLKARQHLLSKTVSITQRRVTSLITRLNVIFGLLFFGDLLKLHYIQEMGWVIHF